MRGNIAQENSQSPRDRRWRQNNFKDINIYISRAAFIFELIKALNFKQR